MQQDFKGVQQVSQHFDVDEYVESEHQSYFEWLLNRIHTLSCDILVVDVRDRLTRVQLELLRQSDIRIVTIDDPEDKRLVADLAFYPPVPQVRLMSWREMIGRWFSGWEYVIVDPRFSQYEGDNAFKSKDRILISMGWSDPQGLSLLVLEALECANLDLCLSVMIGSGSKWIPALKKHRDRSRHHIELYQDPSDRVSFMADHAVAIVAFGVTAYVLIALGVPQMMVSLTSDHDASASVISGTGAAINLGLSKKIVPDELIRELQTLLSNKDQLHQMKLSARSVPIGKGASTIASMVMNSWSGIL